MKSMITGMALAVLGMAAALPAQAQTARSAAEQRNLEFAQEFWTKAYMPRKVELFKNYFAEDYVDHNPNITTKGLAGMIEFVNRANERMRNRPQPNPGPASGPPPSDIVVALVDGDYVTFIRKRKIADPTDSSKSYEAYGFDTLRIENGKIAEHWDAATKMGPPPPPPPPPAQ